MLKEADSQKPLSYATQSDWIKKAFHAIGLTSVSKITHMPRGEESRQTERAGVNEAQIRRAGR